MIITIENFRSHSYSTYDFTAASIILLKGEPGAGKTTILQAISWALYGTIRNIGNHLTPKASTKVRLYFDDLPTLGHGVIIERRTQSNLLQISVGYHTERKGPYSCQDDEAQNMINKTLGPRKHWLGVSCLEQGQASIFIQGTGKEKLAFLNNLAFCDEDPQLWLNKINDTIKVAKENNNNMEKNIEGQSQALTVQIAACNFTNQLTYTPKEKERLQAELVQITEKISTVEDEERQYLKLRGRYEILREEVQTKQKLLLGQPSVPDTQQEINKHRAVGQNLQQEIDSITQQLALLELEQKKTIQNLQVELQTKQQQETQYLSQVNQYNIIIQGSQVEKKRLQTSTDSIQRESGPLIQNVEKLQKSIEENGPQLKPWPSEQEWPTLQQVGQAQQLEQAREQYSTEAKQLHIEYGPHVEQQVTKIQEDIVDLRQIQQNYTRYKQLQDHINKISLEIETLQNAKRQLDDTVQEASKCLVPLPAENEWPSLVQVGRVREIEQARQKYIIVANELNLTYDNSIESHISTYNSRVVELEHQFRDYAQYAEYKSLQQQIQELVKQLGWSSPTDSANIKSIIAMAQNQLGEKEAASLLLTCPHCQKGLRLESGNLIADHRLPPPAQELIALRQSIATLQNLEPIVTRLEFMDSQGWTTQKLASFARIQSKHDLEQELILLRDKLSKIQSIRWIDAPVMSSQKLQQLVQLHKDILELQTLTMRMEKLEQDKNTYQSQLSPRNANVEPDQLDQNLKELYVQQQQLSQIKWLAPPAISSHRLLGLVQFKQNSTELLQNQERTKILRAQLEQNNQSLIDIDKNIMQAQTGSITVQHNLEQVKRELLLIVQRLEKDQEPRTNTHDLQQKLTTKRQEYSSVITQLQKCELQLQQRENDTCQAKNKEQELNVLQKQLAEHNVDQLHQLRAQMEQIRTNFIKIDKGLPVMQWYNKLAVENARFIEEKIKFLSLNNLRQNAEEVMYNRLSDVVRDINSTMTALFGAIFEDPIDVSLCLFKEYKQGKNFKPLVNMAFHYKGMKYDKMEELSGGEKNRINLGLIMALNLISSSPFLLIDEPMSFLNERLKTRCLNQIRLLMANKTVIVVSHDDNEANYDQIISLGCDSQQQ